MRVSMNQVAAVQVTEAAYPAEVPYHPADVYPEYPFPGRLSHSKNAVYEGVRRLFTLLNLDREHAGTAAWNPLSGLIQPGMTVVLKPNFVLSRHKDGKDLFSIITHPSVLRAVADYCWIALRGRGRIVIADAPQYDCNFRELLEATRLDEVVSFYTRFKGPTVGGAGPAEILVALETLFHPCSNPYRATPTGALTVNLGRNSALYGKPNPEKLYGAVYRSARNDRASPG